ncbi:MAG TPA: phosphatase PAP2 family protein, partial [Minicystis sp.]|nr:phosphatase PAP2 family protein [Minicystis sp.]
MKTSARALAPAIEALEALVAELGPIDRLELTYLGALAALTIAFARPMLVPLLAIGVVAAALPLAAVASRTRLGRGLRDVLPVGVVAVAFNLSAPAIAGLGRPMVDARLAALDARLAPLAHAWEHALGRPDWLTDLASIAYVSFYALPVVVALGALSRHGRGAFEACVFTVVATFLVSYVGYFVWPATGPRLSPAEEPSLGGGAVRAGVFAFLHVVEKNPFDAFPSGHTAVSLVSFGLGSRALPRLRAPLAVVTIAIVFSTVYLHLHYVTDVLAGMALAAVMPLVVWPLARLYGV